MARLVEVGEAAREYRFKTTPALDVRAHIFFSNDPSTSTCCSWLFLRRMKGGGEATWAPGSSEEDQISSCHHETHMHGMSYCCHAWDNNKELILAYCCLKLVFHIAVIVQLFLNRMSCMHALSCLAAMRKYVYTPLYR
jgi:hypothetical protein